MADTPDQLTLRRHRDLVGRERRPVVRWIGLGAVGIFIAAGLLNVFGQRPATDLVGSDVAQLKIYAPTTLRGGLYYEARFTIDAKREIENATIVLESGWMEGMTLNTVEPAPVGEASRDGDVAFELGHIPAGDTHILYLQFQVNPTNVGRRSVDVELTDGETPLLRVERTVTIWP